LGFDSAVVSIAAGLEFTCAATANGTGYCWGGEAEGVLGTASRTPTATPRKIDW
jgi:alpha-tubulin suppressor-like RCC1 family protein